MRHIYAIVLSAVTVATAGCTAAAVGAAGAGATAIYLTTRGAETMIKGDMDQLAQATRTAFDRLGIEASGEKDKGEGERELYGTVDGRNVTVELERASEQLVDVEVRVRKSAVRWDKDMARRIAEEIQQVSEGPAQRALRTRWAVR